MVLAEVSHPLIEFLRLETFSCYGAAAQWVEKVIKTDPMAQPHRNNMRVKIHDIPTGRPLADAYYMNWC